MYIKQQRLQRQQLFIYSKNSSANILFPFIVYHTLPLSSVKRYLFLLPCGSFCRRSPLAFLSSLSPELTIRRRKWRSAHNNLSMQPRSGHCDFSPLSIPTTITQCSIAQYVIVFFHESLSLSRKYLFYLKVNLVAAIDIRSTNI